MECHLSNLLLPHACMVLQLMTWSATSATFAFSGASSITVVLNGSLQALPVADRRHAKVMPNFPRSVFQVW